MNIINVSMQVCVSQPNKVWAVGPMVPMRLFFGLGNVEEWLTETPRLSFPFQIEINV